MQNISVENLINKGAFECPCGKTHSAHLKKAVISRGAVSLLPEFIKEYGCKKPYVLADINTVKAGEKALEVLDEAGIEYVKYVYNEKHIEPDDTSAGKAFLNFSYSCDIVIGIGSGVINDIGKIVSRMTGLPYIIVGTAPSMDGYASSTSSVIRDGLKVSVDSRCPDIVIGDLDILCKAPAYMAAAGLGDMLAKYISVCEWRIGNVVTGEYYCEEVASIIRYALNKCVEGADKLAEGDEETIRSIMEGLVISGIAADYAGVSRPVSGVEHYFSHIWDMRNAEFGTPMDLHGIQCGIGTLLAVKGYNRLLSLSPDKEKAAEKFGSFDIDAWREKISGYLGSAGEQMIKNTRTCELYNGEKFNERIENICDNWNIIKEIVSEEIPRYETVLNILKTIKAPVSSDEIGIPSATNPLTFRMTKDIRDKYILSTLLFDMGLLDETAEDVFGAGIDNKR
ncbi:MAG: sn-glycerol-1-phosphate dehydrogenase [Clostridia bacterium]|nr:sn-glycerol-1-phosphate dehydrogenase [Clostridia bacterium]